MTETQAIEESRSSAGPLDVLAAPLSEVDPEIAELIGAETARQRATLDLVASENVPPRAVLEAQGSVLSAKYADGYPGHRDYDTCQVVDEIELLAIERAKHLFGAGHANVQPYSGSNANFCVIHALCDPGDVVLGFDFAHGGHPTHNDRATFAGRYYEGVGYHVRRADRRVDMDEVLDLAAAPPEGDLRRLVLLSAVPRLRGVQADMRRGRCVSRRRHGALLRAGGGGDPPDPVGYADVCTMTVHKTLGGARGGAILSTEALADRIDAAVYPGEQGCPLMHVIAAKAVTFALASTDGYRERMRRTVDGAQIVAAALVAAAPLTGATVVTGGTDVHQLLVDLSGGDNRSDGSGAPRHTRAERTSFAAAGGTAGQQATPASTSWSETDSSAEAGRQAWAELRRLNVIGVSANAIRLAYDPLAEPGASGLRFGTAALASRGFGRAEFSEVGAILAEALAIDDRAGPAAAASCVERVRALTEAFPLYGFIEQAPGQAGR